MTGAPRSDHCMLPDRTQQRTPANEWVAWLAALLIAGILLPVVHFRTLDSDSILHANIAARLSTLPFSRWIAPEWWGGMNHEGLYREHPIGIFILPALVGKIGYPATEAAFWVNAWYEVLTLILLRRLAMVLVTPVESRALAWLVQFLPIAFVYRVRANHEQAVLLCLLAAMWGTHRSRTSARWIALTAFAAIAMALVKGVFVVFVFVGGALWLLTVRREDDAPATADWNAWLGLGIAAVAVVAAIAGYEAAYRQVTHESFLAVYWGRQMGTAALARGVAPLLLRKLHNLYYYGKAFIWFPFPASLAAVAAVWWRRDLFFSLLGRRRGGSDLMQARAASGLAFTMGLSVLYVLAFTLSDRTAERYIFPAYYLVGACGFVAMMRGWGAFGRWVERLDRHRLLPVLVWLPLFLLGLPARLPGLPRIVNFP